MQYSTTEGREPLLVVSEGRSQPMMSSVLCAARMSKTAQQRKERVRSFSDKRDTCIFARIRGIWRIFSMNQTFWFQWKYSSTREDPNNEYSKNMILWSSPYCNLNIFNYHFQSYCRNWKTPFTLIKGKKTVPFSFAYFFRLSAAPEFQMHSTHSSSQQTLVRGVYVFTLNF